MKNKIVTIALALMFAATTQAQPGDAAGLKHIVLKPEGVYIPQGFSNHNNAQVVVAGMFRSFCFSVAPTKYKVNLKTHKIYITNSAYVSPGCSDALLMIPYSAVINVGALPVGEYKVMTLGENGKFEEQGMLPVSQAISGSEGRDDYLYAPITDAILEFKKDAPTAPTLTLKGVFSNSCMSLQNVEVVNRDTDVVEVLPFAKMDNNNCINKATPFSVTVTLQDFPKSKTLIHIRSMNGQSINKVVSYVERIPTAN